MSAASSTLTRARLLLARMTAKGGADLSRAFEQATEASARAINVARVGVWFFDRPDSLVCATSYDARTESHERGAELDLAPCPTYRNALRSKRLVIADDARAHEATRELTTVYLEPRGITSMLDAPIFRAGEVIGVVCHEHVGTPRKWTQRERDFTASVADVLAVLLEQAARIDIEAEIREQRQRLVQLERFQALARLGAGVAHDFNNVLTVIRLQLEAMQATVAGGPAAHLLKEALQSTENGSQIAHQLLAFSKETPTEPRDMDLSRVVREARTMLTTLAKAHDLRLEIPSERLVVHADPSQLHQVLLNLVINACEAMPGGGEVHVRLSATEETVRLEVQDAGPGIEPEAIDRIFEPFFTTKGHGTGLGLAIVKSIVDQNGGTISVSRPHEGGTRFLISLPRVE